MGMLSMSVAGVAATGPAFLTVIPYVRFVPVVPEGEALADTVRSANDPERSRTKVERTT